MSFGSVSVNQGMYNLPTGTTLIPSDATPAPPVFHPFSPDTQSISHA